MTRTEAMQELADAVWVDADHFTTAYAYRDLLKALEAYANRSQSRDQVDVASELEHFTRRINRLQWANS